ncbi:serpin B8-like [Saccostrea echinata]|uniref:serpin B8-like n=1 Tax=Saccostrea echinata TaxID=191078 RepID=UPI002A808A6B|nr:serpin B8-like [Saccostrea echinata]
MLGVSFHRRCAACFVFLLIYCASHKVTTTDPAFQNSDTATAFTKANKEFMLNLLKQLPSESNIFYSPFSISTALAMVHLGAGGETLKEMNQALHFGKLDRDIYSAFGRYLEFHSKATGNNTLNTANRIYQSTRYTAEESFLQSSAKYFSATVESVDFSQSEASSKKINSWVSQKTENKIQNLIPADALSSQTLMVLVNAIYFKGIWNSKFEAKDTKKMEFRNGKAKFITDMMYQIDRFKFCHVSDLRLDILELPYEGKTISMVILLPVAVDGLEAVERSLTETTLRNAMSTLKGQQVEVYLPKFKMESSFQLKCYLSALGMPSAFDPSRASFSGIYKDQDVFMSEVFHKAFVDLNEEGTEAAAATGVVISRQLSPEFRADHPFLFFIRDTVNDVILFAGRFNNPVSVQGIRDSNSSCDLGKMSKEFKSVQGIRNSNIACDLGKMSKESKSIFVLFVYVLKHMLITSE